MRIFGRDKQKPIVEKPLITYYAKYVGHLSSNLSIPTTEPIYCHIYRDRIVIDFLNKPNKGKLVTVAYDAMTEMGNLDGGKKADWNRAAPLAIIALTLVLAGGFLIRQAVITVIKYKDSNLQDQTLVIDFLVDVGSAQPMIYQRFLEAQLRKKNNDTSNSMICQNCANVNIQGSAYCSKCGNRL